MGKTGLNAANIKKLDKSNMLGLLRDFPDQCRYAYEISRRAQIPAQGKDYNKIVFAGLGGSAIGADLIKAYLYFESRLPIGVCREYELPACVDERTLVFICSYSGNTEETLSAYNQAKEKKGVVIAISSGGRLKELAQKDKYTFIEIPQGLPPRCSLGYLSIVPLGVLAKMGLCKDVAAALNQMTRSLEELRDNNLLPSIASADNIAKFVTSKIYNKFTAVYSAGVHFDVCATRFRGQIAENSKALASSHVFPEMNHNEIVGWQNPVQLLKNCVVIILRDKGMHPRVAKRMDITKEILKKQKIEVIEIWSRGDDLLTRIFSLIHIGDYVSYYLAIAYGIDPTPVDRITYLKNQLAKE